MSDRLVIQERHAQHLQEFLLPESGHERAAYLLCSQVEIESDPWTGRSARRFISHRVLPISESEIISSSAHHITWSTQSFVNTLKQAQTEGLTAVLVHSHPGGLLAFSEQDDLNESDLIQLAHNRNGQDLEERGVRFALLPLVWVSVDLHYSIEISSKRAISIVSTVQRWMMRDKLAPK